MKLTVEENDSIKEFEEFMIQQSENDAFSGSVLAAKNGTPVFERAFGYAHKGHEVMNRIDTKFNLGSMDKMFTAVSIIQLYEKGIIELEAPIGNYLFQYPPELANNMTIRHLLTHTSGMGSYFNEHFKTHSKRFKTVKDYEKLVINEPLLFQPGAKVHYSNSGYIVLGAIIESVSGTSYYDYVQENIFKPLCMSNTGCFDLEYDVPNLAQGYTLDEHSHFKNNLFDHVVKGGPAGGGYSTVIDLLRFDVAIRNNKLIEMNWPELATFGFLNFDIRGERIVGFHGGFPGIDSALNMYMTSGWTLALLSNYDNATLSVMQKFDALLKLY